MTSPTKETSRAIIQLSVLEGRHLHAQSETAKIDAEYRTTTASLNKLDDSSKHKSKRNKLKKRQAELKQQLAGAQAYEKQLAQRRNDYREANKELLRDA